ncbi:MAG: discoidin domain-containing protein [Fimbriimonadaceae bacterium]
MKRLVPFLCALALSASALSQTKVACIGDSTLMGAYPQQLQTILGGKFDVKAFGLPRASVTIPGARLFLDSPPCRAAMSYLPDVVVVMVDDDGPMGPAKSLLDRFEPAFRNLLVNFRSLSSQPKVYVWTLPDAEPAPGTQGMAERYNSYVHPLAIQAAREAGAMTIEKDYFGLEPLTAASPSAREAAEFVAEILAPATLKAGWRIVRASSFQADEGSPQNAIDGDPDTYWHTEYDPKLARPPHEIVLDLGSSQWLVGFKYLPRQDGGVNGNVKDYEIYVGDTPDAQTALVAKGAFSRGPGEKTARFKHSVRTRYIRFVCLSEQSGGPYASAAELDVIRDPSKN